MHKHGYAHIYEYATIRTHIHKHTYAHIHTHSYIHTCTHSHTPYTCCHICTRTHTHAVAHILCLLPQLLPLIYGHMPSYPCRAMTTLQRAFLCVVSCGPCGPLSSPGQSCALLFVCVRNQAQGEPGHVDSRARMRIPTFDHIQRVPSQQSCLSALTPIQTLAAEQPWETGRAQFVPA